MKRIALAAAGLLLMGASALAGGAEDLAAARQAGEKGVRDEAIRLYTQAIAAGDLKADDRLAALRGRGGEYASKGLIADAFNRRDEAARMRENAIADFSAAITLKPGDVELISARAQVLHMNGQYDAALADFDTAVKLKPSALAYTQRAASARAKGDYDRAAADYTAALAANPRDSGIEETDILSERGYSSMLAGRYDAAAADFARSITSGAAERQADVMWLPYQTAWLHLARARAGKDDAEELKANAGRIDLKQWPGTVVAYFMGQTTLDQVSSGSSHGSMGRGRECGLSFFAGEQALARNDKTAAAPLLQRAREVCNVHTIYSLGAATELKRLGK